jgi:hypothetical protein
MHIDTLVTRGILLNDGRPMPGDTQETLIRLLKRGLTELPWPELPGGTKMLFGVHLRALTLISQYGEPEAAIELLSRHVGDVERGVVASKGVAAYYMYRLDLLLSAAMKAEEHGEKRAAFVAEAKGLMERATRSLRGLQPQDWDQLVSDWNRHIDPSDLVRG